jgi:hypothetical protein
MTGKAKVALGCGIGCLGLAVVSGVGALLWVGHLADAPQKVEVSVEAPPRVARDQEFAITVRVRNTAGKPCVLDSLDVADEYLAGVAIRSSEPPFKDTMHLPIDNSNSYEYKKTIPPGQDLVVRFRAVALRPGDHSGDIDVCVDWGGNCTSHPLRTMVD